jgi:outer membrane protein assembly factor BamB
LLVFAFCALCVFARNTFSADWVHWRGPFQTGFSPEKDLPSSFSPDPKASDNNLIWKVPYGCRSTPLVMQGRVYILNNVGKGITEQERVMAFDADTGKVLWEYKFNVWHTDIVSVRLGWTNLAGDPATGNVYAHGTQGLLLCLNKDGKLVWSRSLTEEYGRITGYGGRVTSPTVDGDLVIIGMVNSSWGAHAKGANRFVAFDKRTGEVVWWATLPGIPRTYYSGLVVATINGERLLISGTSDGAVVGLKVRTGELVWSYTFGATAINAAPVVEGNLVYCGHGEESPDNNVHGRVVCVDASQVKDGKPKLVWQQDGIRCRYASPVVHDGLLYVPDEDGKLFCLDATTGKRLWKYNYGRQARGSPVLADGKIYVGEVHSRFHILKPTRKKCTELHEQFFASPDGVSDVEINGSAAVANGRVYFATSDEFLCIGKKGAQPAPKPVIPDNEGKPGPDAKPAHLQVLPADVELRPGESVTFKVRAFDDKGRFLREVQARLSLVPTELPTGKTVPPIKATVEGQKLTVPQDRPTQAGQVKAQAGLVKAQVDGISGTARVRVVPRLPYVEDFAKIPDGGVPPGWVNCAGKFLVASVSDGKDKTNKVLRKVNDKSNPSFSRGNTYFGLPSMKDYTIEADLMGTKVLVKGKVAEEEGKEAAPEGKGKKGAAGGKEKEPEAGAEGKEYMPDMGIVANRYTLMLAGNIQKLRIVSWSALPRVDETISWAWKPGVWYRMKLTVETRGDTAVIRGKVWPRDQAEPAEWTIETTDSRPNTEGCPALYGYVTGITDVAPGNDIYYDNVRVTSNKK